MADKLDLEFDQQFLYEFKTEYLNAVPEKISHLESLIMNMEKDEDIFQGTLKELLREAHSIKGSSGSLGLPILSTINHNLEEQLKLLGSDYSRLTGELITNYLKYVDLMKTAVNMINDGEKDFTNIEDALNNLRGHEHTTAKYRGLIVDSTKYWPKVCAQALIDYPIHFRVINNGYTALGYLLQAKYDLLITGMEVEMLTGAGLIAAVKSTVIPGRNPLCILMTSNKDLLKKPKKIGADYTLSRDQSLLDTLKGSVRKSLKGVHQIEL